MEDDLKKIKMEDDLKQNMKMEDNLNFFLKTRMKNSKRWKMSLKKMEDDLKKKWKATSKK